MKKPQPVKVNHDNLITCPYCGNDSFHIGPKNIIVVDALDIIICSKCHRNFE